MPFPFHLTFQDSLSPLMEQLSFFHDHTMLAILMITSLVAFLFIMLITNKLTNRFLMDAQGIETLWTSFPAILLLLIALPSLQLLYMLDEVHNPSMTLKIMGHQWYWSYEYSDFKDLNFDSYMINHTHNSNFRLLDVDNRVILPSMNQIRVMATSADVIHSWAVPSLGIKIDTVPGRLNQSSFMIARPAIMFGQCSEICGANHSFMPIVLESIPQSVFMSWLRSH